MTGKFQAQTTNLVVLLCALLTHDIAMIYSIISPRYRAIMACSRAIFGINVPTLAPLIVLLFCYYPKIVNILLLY